MIERTFVLSEAASRFIDKQCDNGSFESPNAYVAHLVEQARIQSVSERLAALIRKP
jgi:hypothetical protein